MRPVNKVVVVMVAVVSVLTLVEAVTGATTEAPSFVSATGSPVVERVLRLVFITMVAGLIVVMVRNAAVPDAGHRSRTVLRWTTITVVAAHTVFDTGWALLDPQTDAFWPADGSSLPWWLALVSLLGWTGIVAPTALGATMLLQGDRSPAAWLLAAATVVSILLFRGLNALGSPRASLACGGVVTDFGLALLGATAPEMDWPRRQETTTV